MSQQVGIVVAAFGVTLLAAVLLSAIAARSALSAAVLFLIAGVVVGPDVFGILTVDPAGGLLVALADIALFVVLFTDGQRLRLENLRSAWRLPGRALLFGMPLTMLGVAVVAWALTGLGWPMALLLGAVLAPTDPVFASAIVKNEGMPRRLRHLLNVESGVNDGLALPVVIVLIAVAGPQPVHPLAIVGELVGGLVLGVGLPLVLYQLLRIRGVEAVERLQPLGPVAVGVLLYGIANAAHVNAYLAAFAGGCVLATMNPGASNSFERFGELLGEVGKFAALFVFGAILTPQLFDALSPGGAAVAVLAFVAVRPVAFLLAGVYRKMRRAEFAAAAWFGPKGFASVVYGLLVLQSALPERASVFAIAALSITLSIAAHSSTDVPVARLLQRREEKAAQEAGA